MKCSKSMRAYTPAIAVLLVIMTEAHSVGLTHEASITASTQFTDNATFTFKEDSDSDWAVSLHPKLALTAAMEKWQATLSAGYAITRYETYDSQDRDNQRYAFSYQYMTERNLFSFQSDINETTTIDTDIEETGIVDQKIDKTVLALSPSWVHVIDERNNLSLSHNHTEQSYAANDSGLLDYKSDVTSVSLRHQFSETRSVNAQVSYLDYRTQNEISRYKVTSAQAGYEDNFTETLKGYLALGITRSKVQEHPYTCLLPLALDPLCLFRVPGKQDTNGNGYVISNDASGRGYVLGAGLTKKLAKSELGIDFSHNLRPSASDGLVTTTSLAIRYNHPFTERLTGSIIANYIKSQQDIEELSDVDTTYYSIEPRIRWRLSEQLYMLTGYRKRVQEESTASTRPENIIYLTIGYDFIKGDF